VPQKLAQDRHEFAVHLQGSPPIVLVKQWATVQGIALLEEGLPALPVEIGARWFTWSGASW
jgi:hypothetical protein